MEKTTSLKESMLYCFVKCLAIIVRKLPANMALMLGRVMGKIMYRLDIKHKSQAYANINMAFAGQKSPREMRRINKKMFENIGQDIIELFRLPLINKEIYEKYVDFEGRNNIDESLKKGKGCILLAMHFGSWEMASISCAMYGYNYKVLVRHQHRLNKLHELLNSYRSCNGSVVLTRGVGTREIVKSLKNNQVIGMVMDQGGRTGKLVPFFDRQASMSIGAVRLGLKLGVPICFSVITRQKGPYHKIKVHEPFELINTGNTDEDIIVNLRMITGLMQEYTTKYPSEYVWMYKIWKYSDEANIVILSDGKTGHLRQSQTVAKMTQEALRGRSIRSDVKIVDVKFKSDAKAKRISFLYIFLKPFLRYGNFAFLKNYLTEKTYNELTMVKPDFVISCGSSVAFLNNLLARDFKAKSIVILKPGLMSYKDHDLVLLPKHDIKKNKRVPQNVTLINGAPNLITQGYIEEQVDALLRRFSHLKGKLRYKIGLLIGGDAKDVYISEDQVRILIRQVKEAAKAINADVLITTSRRTPAFIDQMFFRELKKDPRCPLVILPNREDVPEAVGGIIGLSDLLIVSGDSISMVSEAASSGKQTIAFLPKSRDAFLKGANKHRRFIEKLNAQGYILSSRTKDIGQSIFDVAKQKIQTRPLDNNQTILEAVKQVI